MPISKSAKKSLRVAQHKTSVNRYRKTLIKAALKNVTADNYSKAISMIDKGVKWNLFHQNKAARMKSALTKGLPEGAKVGPKNGEKVAPSASAKTTKKPTKPAAKKVATKPAKKTVKPAAKKATNPPAGGKK